MDVLKQAWERVQGLYKRLSPSQQLTVGLLGIVVAFAFWMMTSLTGGDNLVPLTRADGSTPPEVMAGIQTSLDADAVPYEVRGGVIYVPVSQRDRLWFKLQGDGQPLADKDPFEWLHQPGIFRTRIETGFLHLHSTRLELERQLRSMEAVQHASVLITPTPDPSTRLFADQKATASVHLTLRGGRKIDRGHASAIASLVAHAVADLRPEDVSITDSQGKLYASPKKDDAFVKAQDQGDAEKRYAEFLKGNVMDILGYIRPEPLVTVRAILDLSSAESKSRQMLTDDSAVTTTRTSSQSEDGMVKARAPGGVANNGDSESTSVLAQNSVSNAKRTDFAPGFIEHHEIKYPFRVQKVMATVILPQQYLARHNIKDPNDFRPDIQKALGAPDVQDLQVSARTFEEPTATPAPPVWAVLLDFLTLHWGQMALLVLILIALGMIYGVVQRAIPSDIAEEIARIRAQLASQTQEEAVAGMESQVDSQAKQMKQTVKLLVQKSPRTVAGILRRWITRR